MIEGINRDVRRQLITRAKERCEYCLMPEWALFAGCEADHIISRKHGGVTELSNLALSCARCNRYKGTDLGSVSSGGSILTPAYSTLEATGGTNILRSTARG